MSKGPDIDAGASRKISDACSEFKLPNLPEDELRQMDKEQWLEQFGEVYSSEQWFERRDPDWAENPDSWWFKMAGRSGGEPPLWMRREWQMAQLDCPPGGDRQSEPVDDRSERPLWAERMNLSGSQGKQGATIFSHRREYRPTEKTDARSMYERYQPGFERVLNEELPDVSDPADGRFWKAGVAQGLTTNPYEKRLVISARRKPIVLGPRTASVVVDGETHTLANAVRDVAWLHPHVELAAYTCEHPVYRHVNLRVQTSEGSGVGGEQGLAETLELAQQLFQHVGAVMDKEVAAHDPGPV